MTWPIVFVEETPERYESGNALMQPNLKKVRQRLAPGLSRYRYGTEL